MPIKFRPEVTQQHQARWNGKVLLLNGWPAWVTVLMTLGFLTALIAFITLTHYTRRITVSGEIITEPHTINLFAPEQGIISQLLVTNGQLVSAGMPLYQIDVSQVARSGNLTVTTLAAIEKQQQQLDAIISQLQNNKRETLANLMSQQDQYQQAQMRLQSMVTSALGGLDAMRRSRDAYAHSLSRGLINTDQMNNQRYLYYQQQSAYQSLNSQAIQQELQITNLRSEQVTRAADFDNQILQLNYQRAGLARQLAEADARGFRLITAPARGRVSSLSVTPGQMVNTGDSLIQIVPAAGDTFQLITWLPDDGRPYVTPGEIINVRYAAFPYEKYGQFPGRIVDISSAPVSARELDSYVSAPRTASGAVSGSWYKATVALDTAHLRWQGKPLAMSSGMLAQSTLFLETRPLYQWILSPYYSLQKSLAGPSDDKR